ncbi:MAG: FG-GAP-like repeat-containing protein [Bacteroidia bacterium]
MIQPDTLICGSQNILVSIKNYDVDTLKHAIISWSVNGVIQNNYLWTGKIASGSSTNFINIGSYAFNSPTTNVIKTWTVSPNGGEDKNTGNDTAQINRKVAGFVNINLGNDTSYVCAGQSILLSVSPGYATYVWSNEQGVVSNTNSYTAYTRGNYIVTVTNAKGCIGKDSVFVIMKDDSFTRSNFGYKNAYSSDWRSVAWMDYNGDDNEDIGLFTFSDNQSHIIATNRGKGKFETQYVSAGGFVTGASWGDPDNDGDADASFIGENAHYILENTGATFKSNFLNPRGGLSTTWVDYDNDGMLDIAMAQPNAARLLHNQNSNGVLYFPADTIMPYSGVSQAWCDYDNDGDQDWFYISDNSHLFANDGKGKFTETTTDAFAGPFATASARGGSWGDYDNDGDMDLFITTFSENLLYRNNGNGTFTKVTNAGSIVTDKKSSKGSTWGDYDNDGYLDLFVNNRYVSPDTSVLRSNSLYRNNGNGTFSENIGSEWNTPIYEPWTNTNCAWGDLDNDGDLDLIQGTEYQANLYINNGNCRNWLSMKLIGTISNRSAIGTKVYLYAAIDGKSQILSREISGQTGYNGQNSLRVHFGIGYTTIIDSVKIVWPSGIKKVLTNVLPNQYLKITEECNNTLCNSVWPGDANSDFVADNKDLLSVGLYYNERGSARDSISTTWMAHNATNWGKLQNNGFEIKHVDCNGDGTIDSKDTLAINLNYQLRHKRNFLQQELNVLNSDLYFTPSKGIAIAGDWIDVEISAGTSAKPVTDLYGLAFNINFEPTLIEPGSISLKCEKNWLGTPLADAIRINKISESLGIADGAFSRIDHINRNGYGKVALLRFRIRTTLGKAYTLPMHFTGYAAVDAAGNGKSFNVFSDSILITSPTTIENTTKAFTDFEIHPNPFVGQTKITYTLNADKNVSLELYNILGQKIETFIDGKQSAGKYTYMFSKEGRMTDNIFIVKLVVDNQISIKRIISF